MASTLTPDPTAAPPDAVAPPLALRRGHLLAILIILLMGAFYGATFRDGHAWGDDFAMYIMHAQNLATGVPYDETKYVYNRHYPSIGPRSYPPGYPLILTPVYAVFGQNFTAFKAATTVFFFLSLYLLFRILQDRLPLPSLLIMLVVIGLNPYFWQFKDEVISDIPFLCLLYLVLYFGFLAETATSRTQGVFYLGMLGLGLFLAVSIRIVGLVLVPAYLVTLVLEGKLRRMLIPFGALTALLVVAIWRNLSIILSYLDNFALNTNYVLRLRRYIAYYVHFFDNGYSLWPAVALLLVFTTFAVWGFITVARKRITILEVFTVLYSTVLVVIQAADGRYMLPLVPLYFYYGLAGINAVLAHSRHLAYYRAAYGALCGALLISYAANYTTLPHGSLPEGVGRPESIALFDFIRSSSDANDVIIFRKPRAMALLADRNSSVYYTPQEDARMWNYMRSIDASYIVVSDFFPEDINYLRPFVNRHSDRLQSLYINPDFEVYRILDYGPPLAQ